MKTAHFSHQAYAQFIPTIRKQYLLLVSTLFLVAISFPNVAKLDIYHTVLIQDSSMIVSNAFYKQLMQGLPREGRIGAWIILQKTVSRPLWWSLFSLEYITLPFFISAKVANFCHNWGSDLFHLLIELRKTALSTCLQSFWSHMSTYCLFRGHIYKWKCFKMRCQSVFSSLSPIWGASHLLNFGFNHLE